MEKTKLTDEELLRQLEIAVSERSCSVSYGIAQAYALGVSQGKCEQARAAVEAARAA